MRKTYLLLILIIAISAFLRFYRLSDVYVFNLDEEYQAAYAWLQVLDPHPIWIGLIAAGLEFYVGPYLVYLTAIFLAISQGDPLITAYFASFLGVITTAIIFFVGNKIYNLTTGVVASLLYATLPLFVFFDQKYWNPMFGPAVTALLLSSLILTRHSKWWWLLFVGMAGAIFETHLPSAPLLLIGIWYFLKGKYWKDFRLVFFCLFVFLAFYWPLIVFDINHNFSNLKVFTRILGKENLNIKIDPTSKFYSLFDSMGRFWYLKPGSPNADEINFGCSSLSLSTGFRQIDKYTQRTYAPFWLSLISSYLLLFFLVKNLTSKILSHKVLALFLTFLIISFLIYPGGAYEYYMLGFLTLFIFVPAILISGQSRNIKLTAYCLILLTSLLGINTVINTSDEFSLRPKKIIISKVMNIIGNESFSIEGRGICHNYEGWRYLFKVYGRAPNQSYTDSGLGWLYPDEISKQSSFYTIILSEDRIPLDEDLSSLPSIKEGGYRAYIRKN